MWKVAEDLAALKREVEGIRDNVSSAVSRSEYVVGVLGEAVSRLRLAKEAEKQEHRERRGSGEQLELPFPNDKHLDS